MSLTITRQRFLQLGLAGLALAAGCDDEGDGTTATGPGGTAGGGTGGDGTGAAGGSGSSNGGNGTGGDGTGGNGTGGNGTGGVPGVGGGGGGGSMCAAMIVAQISANHGHSLVIPLADVMAGMAKTYDASGSAQHCHEVTLEDADFATLQAGGTVIKKSCNGTDHEFVISCEANPPNPQAPDCDATPNEGSCN
jgi:hypothetical protein